MIVTIGESKDATASVDGEVGGSIADAQQSGAGAAGQRMSVGGSGGSLAGGGMNAGGGSGEPGDAPDGGGDVAIDRTLAAVTACEEGGSVEHLCSRNFNGLICTELEIYTVKHNDACIDAAIDAFSCEASLSCPALDTYLNGPTADPFCGAKAKHYEENCGFQTEPAPGCVAYCNKAASCLPSIRPQACAYHCNIQVGAMAMGNPSGCGSARDAQYGCYAGIDCSAMTDLIKSQIFPISCYDAAVASKMACPN
jgi:hypothetical protein